MDSPKKTIGVLGGMGPEATAYFFGRLIARTAARRDQDHAFIIVDSNPRIPERTAAVLGRGPSPAPQMLEEAGRLARAGADFIVVPCVTAHAFLPWVRERTPVPFVSLLDEAAAHVRRLRPRLGKVGLLATTGTVTAGLFVRAFEAVGIEVIAPAKEEQRLLMSAIYGRGGIKAGRTDGPPRRQVLTLARRLVRRGAEAVVAGCTEIPLVLREKDLPVPLVEPMDIAAVACLHRAGYRVRKA